MQKLKFIAKAHFRSYNSLNNIFLVFYNFEFYQKSLLLDSQISHEKYCIDKRI